MAKKKNRGRRLARLPNGTVVQVMDGDKPPPGAAIIGSAPDPLETAEEPQKPRTTDKAAPTSKSAPDSK